MKNRKRQKESEIEQTERKRILASERDRTKE